MIIEKDTRSNRYYILNMVKLKEYKRIVKERVEKLFKLV